MTAAPLFIAEPTFGKQANVELSQDPSNWEVEVTRYIHEKLPFVAEHPIKVAFEKVDDKLGFGTGSLVIGNEGQVKVSAPILVREFELLPVDVFIQKNAKGGEATYLPLNEDRLEAALFDTHMFAGAVPPQESSGGYANNYPPHSGKYVYASGKPNLLEEIKHTISETDKQYFLGKLAQDERLRATYQSRGLLDTIRKIASYGRAPVEPGVRPVHKVLTPNVIQIEKIGYDQFRLRAVSDAMYAPIEKEMDGDEVIEKFGRDAHSHIVDNNEYITMQGRRPVSPVTLEGMTSELKKLTTYGRVEVRTCMNDRLVGWLFPKVVNLDGTPMGSDKLFTDCQEIYSLQEDIAGREITDSLSLPEDPPHCELKMGATGVFYYKEDGRAFCTVPLTITSPVCDMGDYIYVEVSTDLGETYCLEISNAIEALTPSRRKKHTVLVPATMRFCEVGRQCQRLQDDPGSVVKVAQEALSDGKGILKVQSDNDGQTFQFSGTQSDYLDGGASDVPRSRAKFHLMSLGMSGSDAEATICRASTNGRVTLTNLKPLLTQHEKEAHVRENVMTPLLRALPSLKTDLIKEAAFLGDAETIDSVLSLNFINMENIKTFVDFVPNLKEASSKTAQLLIASRLGMGSVPEEAAKKAMDNLERVIQNLENLESAAQLQG
jgi:hypothetical protein